MELRHVRYFLALAESLNFTQAAERVHVAQSTLSHQIKQLEDEVGKPLFDRIGKRVVLTEAGDLFVGYASRALRELDQGINVLRTWESELADAVKIGVAPSLNVRFLPSCASRFIAIHPSVQLSIYEMTGSAIAAQLKTGDLDLGITYELNAGYRDLHFEPLFREELALVVNDAHPLAKRKEVRMAELHRMRVVLPTREFTVRARLHELFQQCDAEPIISIEMSAVSPMLALIARTDLAGLIARDAAKDSGLRVVTLEGPSPVSTAGLLWPRRKKMSVPTQAMANFAREIALNPARLTDDARLRFKREKNLIKK